MCFSVEADWTAMVSKDTRGPATARTSCDECHRPIEVGQFVLHVHQEESEECLTCSNGYCECEDGECCQCEKPDMGEVFDYDRCEECSKFLDAVEAVEVDAGCSSHEARPLLTAMVDDIGCANGDKSAAEYFDRAKAMYPEIVASGYLLALWQKMGFDEEEP